jgi:murein DD-endopeptidase MepM/ murein hydrolase activator NlpD
MWLLAGLGFAPALGTAPAVNWGLPLAAYPIDDPCLAWGGLNNNFQRCGRPGKHVADDACAPNGTPVLAIAAGRLRYAAEVDDCFSNWGWVIVVEHRLPDGSFVCSIYGHCEPLTGVQVGQDVEFAQPIAAIANPCIAHIHFGLYRGSFQAAEGSYPAWLRGYLPDGPACEASPDPFPGNWLDPVAFVLERVAVAPAPWTRIKFLYR